MPTNEELFDAVRLLKDYCAGRKACDDREGFGECPLFPWCSRSLIAEDSPCNWSDPEGGR